MTGECHWQHFLFAHCCVVLLSTDANACKQNPNSLSCCNRTSNNHLPNMSVWLVIATVNWHIGGFQKWVVVCFHHASGALHHCPVIHQKMLQWMFCSWFSFFFSEQRFNRIWDNAHCHPRIKNGYNWVHKLSNKQRNSVLGKICVANRWKC
mgnify:CR=1 FL=1